MKSCLAAALLPLCALTLGCDAGGSSEGLSGSHPNGGTGNSAGGSAGVTSTGGSAGTGSGGSLTGSGGSLSSGGASAGSSGSGGSGVAGSGTGGSGTLGGGSNGFFPTTVTEANAQSAYDSWKATYLGDCGTNGLRVKHDDLNNTVSEGIGYGALLAAAWGDKTTFDGVWTYYQKAAAVADGKKGTSHGLMGWKVYSDACTLGNMEAGSASDADLDMAMGLLQAECVWGGGTYLAGATQLINAIKQYQTKSVTSGTALLPGDNWGDNTYCENPSYFSPGYYRVFAKVVTADATFWNKMADDTYTFLNLTTHATSGLTHDWDTNGSGGCGNTSMWYGYDAARTPWRIATDYVWWGTPAAKTWLDKITGFVSSTVGGTNLRNIKPDGFDSSGSDILDGTNGKGNSVFVGAFATGAIATSQADSDAFHTSFINIPGTVDNNYFKATTRALYLLLSTNKFSPGCY